MQHFTANRPCVAIAPPAKPLTLITAQQTHDRKADVQQLSTVQPGRRSMLATLAAALLAGPQIAAPAQAALPTKQQAALSRQTNPYTEGKSLQYGPLNGRIRNCPGGYNPNCVSTASLNELYAPAWEAPRESPVQAAEELERAVQETCPDSQLADSQSIPGQGEYRQFTVGSKFGRDVVEFLVREPSASSAAGKGLTVTYRSMAGSVKYIWPLQTPVTDFGEQRKRTSLIRERLGWRVIGCELIECYQ